MNHLEHYPRHKHGEKLIVVLDPSTMANTNCLRHYEFQNLMGLTPKAVDHKLEYGQAVHIAIANHYNGMKVRDALNTAMAYFMGSTSDPGTDYRNEMHLMKCINEYFIKYSGDSYVPYRNSNGRLAVEMPFLIPWKSTEYFDVLIGGVVDTFGKHAGRENIVKDVKTTSLWDVDKFFDKYRYNIQMVMYAYAIKWYAKLKSYPLVMIDGIFLQASGKPAKYQRSGMIDMDNGIVDDQLHWLSMQIDTLMKALTAAVEGEHNPFPRNPTCCESVFGACQYKKLCWGFEKEKEIVFPAFMQRIYDPSKFGEVPQVWTNTNNGTLLKYLQTYES